MLLDCIVLWANLALSLPQKKTRSFQGGLSLSVCLRALASDRPPRGGNNHAGGANHRLHAFNLPYRRLYVNRLCAFFRPFRCLYGRNLHIWARI